MFLVIANTMEHTCTRCNKSYPTSVSLGKHAKACRKRWAKLVSLETTPLAQGPESSRGRKRPHVGKDDDEEQAGPSQADSGSYDEVCHI